MVILNRVDLRRFQDVVRNNNLLYELILPKNARPSDVCCWRA